jgi:acyl-CoA dehydrogenase
VASEVLEAFGGAGYVEDTGLPVLLRDSQVLPIWEGTTNVLSLDALRAISKDESLESLKARVASAASAAQDAHLKAAGRVALSAVTRAEKWLLQTLAGAQAQLALEAGGRRFALTLGRALALALLTEHAQWALEYEQDGRPRAAARCFGASNIDLIKDSQVEEAFALANDQPLPAT